MPVTAILAIIEALAQFAPQIPEIVQAIQTVTTLINENRAPTADEKTAIDAGLEAAHNALQAS